MVSLEQVRALESRVERALAYIASLREESAELSRRLAEAQSFIDDAANELGAAEAAAAAAEAKTAEAERRAVAAESLRQAEASATAERIREFESRLADMAERVASAETMAAELSSRAEEYRRDQAKIEEGIVHALQKLDSFEDLVLSQAEKAEPAAIGSGIAVKSAPDGASAEAGAEVREIERVENELDIF